MSQSHDEIPYKNGKLEKLWQHKNTSKMFDYTAIVDRRGRSVGITAFTQLVWLYQFTGSQPSH